MPGATDPNDPQYAADPAHYVFVNGRWQHRDTVVQPGDPNAPGGSANPVTSVSATSLGGSVAPFGYLQRTAPGAELDTTLSSQSGRALQPFLDALQQQAQTGDGAWQQQLTANTQQAQNAASAVGQAKQGPFGAGDTASAIGNARASAEQQAVGQANVLRAQQQQEAQRQLADSLAQQQALEAQQAAQQAAARQGVTEANQASLQQAQKNNQGFLSSLGQVAMAALSDGGAVPGKPRVFGDDETNDTVPAMLSPGEIVIPRSIATQPDADMRAADFVRAVKASHGHSKHNFDDGGVVDSSTQGGMQSFNPITALGGIGPQAEAASQANGALLDTIPYLTARNQMGGNLAAMGQGALGAGPTAAPQQMTNATDANIAQAMAGRGNLTMLASEETKEAGKSAGERAAEQSRAMQATTQALARQRQQDLAFARAQQEAAFRNSMMNQGIGLAQQQQLMGMLSGAGQAAMGISGMFGNNVNSASDTSAIDKAFNEGGGGGDSGSIDAAFNGEGGSAMGDWNPGGSEAPVTAAHGGLIEDKRTRAFLAALRENA